MMGDGEGRPRSLSLRRAEPLKSAEAVQGGNLNRFSRSVIWLYNLAAAGSVLVVLGMPSSLT